MKRHIWLIFMLFCRLVNELWIDVFKSLIAFSEDKDSRQKVIERQ